MRLLLLFFILESLFKLSGSKPLKKQNKAKNIDLLNAHLKTEHFIGRKILRHIQDIFLLTLFSSSE
jgi:hypothetical protein